MTSVLINPYEDSTMTGKDSLKIVVAFDSFKGCISAEEACDAAAYGIHAIF